MSCNVPECLNGYPVRDHVERNNRNPGELMVLVEREGHPVHPWVVATWAPSLGREWVWGHYYETRKEARGHLMAIASRETRVTF